MSRFGLAWYHWLWLLCWSIGGWPLASAASSVHWQVAGHYEESAGAQTVAEMLAAPARFQQQATWAGTSNIRWLKLILHNTAEQSVTQVLDLGVPDIEQLEAWWVPAGQPAKLQFRIDEWAPYAARPLPTRRLALPVQLAAGEQGEWLLRYRTHATTMLPLQLHSPEAYAESLADGNLSNGLLLGILLALLILALLQGLLLRQQAFLAYAVLAALMIAFVLQFEGYNFAWWWPEAGRWNQVAPSLLLGAIQVAHCWLAISFFNLRQQAPWLCWCYRAYLLLLLGAVVAFLGLGWLLPGMLVAQVGVVLVLVTGWIFLRRGQPFAGPFLAGALLNMLFSNLLFGIALLGHEFPVSPFVFPKLGYLCEALCFALALAWQAQALRQQIEHSLRRHLAEAEELVRAENERQEAEREVMRQRLQLAAAGHDLSQPLASIRLALVALQHQGGSEAIANHIDRALDYTESMLGALVDDARRSYEAQADLVSLGRLLAEACERHAPAAAQRGITLRFRPNAYRIVAPRRVLERLLDNLLANAIKHGAHRVLVGVRYRGLALEIQVRDAGRGLEPQLLRHLGEPFRQGAGALAAGQGYGLGLSIVRSLCQRLDYRLTVFSKAGRGTVFGIVIPCSLATSDNS